VLVECRIVGLYNCSEGEIAIFVNHHKQYGRYSQPHRTMINRRTQSSHYTADAADDNLNAPPRVPQTNGLQTSFPFSLLYYLLIPLNVLFIISSSLDPLACSIPYSNTPNLSSSTPFIFRAHVPNFSHATTPPLLLSTLESLSSMQPSTINITVQSSDALSSDPNTIPLHQYLHFIDADATKHLGISYDDVEPSDAYFFGFTYHKPWSDLLGPESYEIPYPLREHLSPSSFGAIAASLDDQISLSLGISGPNTGVSFHTHGPVLSHQIHGQKSWLLYDPTRSQLPATSYSLSRVLFTLRLLFSPTNTIPPPLHHHTFPSTRFLAFLRDPAAASWYQRALLAIDPPFYCTLGPSEVLYIPADWWHATVNEGEWNLFVSNFF